MSKRKKKSTALPEISVDERPKPEVSSMGDLTRLEQSRALDFYSEALRNADTRVMGLFEHLTEQIERSYTYSLWLYTLTLIAGLIIIGVSLYIALLDPLKSTFSHVFSVIGLIIGLGTLLFLLIRNPIRSSRQLVENLIKLNVIFLSYVRRVQQTDLLLKYTFLQNESIDVQKVYTLVQEVQSIVDQAVEEINQVLDGLSGN